MMKCINQVRFLGILIAAAMILSASACKKPASGGETKGGKMESASTSSVDMVKAKAAYIAGTCQTCHGDTGKADTATGKALKARVFSDVAGYKQGTSEDDIFNTIAKGVPGTAMVAFPNIAEADRRLIAQYVVSLQK